MMDQHAELTLLRDRFAAAADRWPLLQSILIRWPESLPLPEFRMKTLPGGEANDGEYHFVAVGYGMKCDTPAGRYRDGYAGALWLHRTFAGATTGNALSVTVDDNEASDQWRQLSRRAAQLTPRVELSAATMRWAGETRWRLICHELSEAPWRPMPGQEQYEQQLISDVFLESATTINKLLVSGAEPQDEHQNEEPLTDTQQAVYDLIKSKGPITGKQINNTLGTDQPTLTSRIIPVLKTRRGVQNKRGAGYWVPSKR